LNPL